MTDTRPPETGRSHARARGWSRWRNVLLVVSLAINLLILGFVATAGFRHGWRPVHSAAQATILSFARTLPSERRGEIWTSIRSERHALRPYWRELRQARAAVRAALTAEPFDLARYRASHDHLLDAEVKVRKAAHSLYEIVATRLTADERRAFAHWQQSAERPWRGRGQRRSDRHGDDEDGDASAPPSAPAGSPAAPSPKP